VSARRSDDGKLWNIELAVPTAPAVKLQARGLVNATGPVVKRFPRRADRHQTGKRVRLIKGSHIVVPRLYEGDHAFILQNSDQRIVFIIPYERSFSVIGTTDIPAHEGEKPVCTREEIDYLCEIASHYMVKPVRPSDVVWTYSGVRPLFDDGDDDPSAGDARLSPGGRRRGRHGAPALGVRRQDHDLSAAGRACLARSRPALPAHGRRMDRDAGGRRRRAGRRTDLRGSLRHLRRLGMRREARPAKELVRVLARRHGVGIDDLLKASRRWPISAGISAAISTRSRCAT
jgi:glycerol-3-phosphate dehydrogenase